MSTFKGDFCTFWAILEWRFLAPNTQIESITNKIIINDIKLLNIYDKWIIKLLAKVAATHLRIRKVLHQFIAVFVLFNGFFLQKNGEKIKQSPCNLRTCLHSKSSHKIEDNQIPKNKRKKSTSLSNCQTEEDNPHKTGARCT